MTATDPALPAWHCGTTRRHPISPAVVRPRPGPDGARGLAASNAFLEFATAHKKVTPEPCTIQVDPLVSQLSPVSGRFLTMNNASIYIPSLSSDAPRDAQRHCLLLRRVRSRRARPSPSPRGLHSLIPGVPRPIERGRPQWGRPFFCPETRAKTGSDQMNPFSHRR